jgi:predicted Ser/Thr protein kinase
MITSQALLANAARQNHFCLRFFYDIYDSTHPAAFRRVLDGSKNAAGPTEPQTPPLSSGRETTPLSLSSIHITVHSELQPGSTGIVHIGTMAVDRSGPTAKVAVKLAFSRDEKSQLMEEHRVYSYLHSKGVQGIARDIGLFVDEEPLLGAEGPYALVMSYAGDSLFGHSKCASDSRASDSVRRVVNPIYISIDSNIICRDSLLATLRSIHRAGILHGDIRLPNLCVTTSGEAFVVDFSHATESRSRKGKAQEIKDLAYILGMDLLTEPVAKDVE